MQHNVVASVLSSRISAQELPPGPQPIALRDLIVHRTINVTQDGRELRASQPFGPFLGTAQKSSLDHKVVGASKSRHYFFELEKSKNSA